MNRRGVFAFVSLVFVGLALVSLIHAAAGGPGPTSDPLARERASAETAPEHQPRLAGGVARLGDDDARIDGSGATLPVGATEVRVGLTAFGRAGAMHGVDAPPAEIAGPEVRIARAPGVTEWWRSLPSGLEQGVTLLERPEGDGDLRLEMSVGDDVRAESAEGGVRLLARHSDEVLAAYTQLVVLDAAGARVPARMAAVDGAIAIVVDDDAALYPLVVDPLLFATTEATLSNPSPLASQRFGAAVSMSQDGSRVIVGVPGSVGGLARIFVRSGTTWSLEAALSAPGVMPADLAGSSVALSGDGTHAIVALPGILSGNPSAITYVRSGPSWTEQGQITPMATALLRACVSAVAMNVDGTRAIVGCHTENGNAGFAQVFTHDTIRWNAGIELCAIAGAGAGVRCGAAVALSADGMRALITRPGASGGAGEAVVLLGDSGGSWNVEGRLAGGAGVIGLGDSASLTRDATRAVIGATRDGGGAAHVFIRSGSTWSTEAVLRRAAGGASDDFGRAVAISDDGARVAVGVPFDGSGMRDSVRMFLRAAGGWSEAVTLDGDAVTASREFGASVSLSGDGGRLAVGIPGDATGGASAGAARIFTLVPTTVLGGACTVGASCASGFCADGVCCNTDECAGGDADCRACVAAQTGMPDGTCAPRRSTEVCRAARAGGCDVAESCNGARPDCPSEARRPGGFICRASGGDCDPAEVCDGFTDTCPGDALAAPASICGDNPLSCSTPGTCDGVSPTCGGTGAPRPLGRVCGPRDPLNPCDLDDICNGMGVCVPMSAAASVPCGFPPSGEPCDAQDHCDGMTATCLAAYLVGVECRGSAGGCDPAEVCLGDTALCGEDTLALAGTVCRESSDLTCDPLESCDGAGPACPADENTCVSPDGGLTDAGSDDVGAPLDSGSDAGVPAPARGCACGAARARGTLAISALLGLVLGGLVLARRRSACGRGAAKGG